MDAVWRNIIFPFFKINIALKYLLITALHFIMEIMEIMEINFYFHVCFKQLKLKHESFTM